MSKLRIFLADDHETVREGLKMIIKGQSDMEVVGEAGDGRAALERLPQLKPDIVLMDISMPHMNGVEATKKRRKQIPQAKVLTLTRHGDQGYVQELLRAGASGYVLKQSAATELLRAIRTVAEGQNFLDPAITEQVVSGYAGGLSRRDQKVSALSDRETEVLKAIARGYSNKEIAARMDLSVKTIEAHKANSMKKLALRGRIDIVSYAVLQGWLASN